MSHRSIAEIESELQVVRRIAERNHLAIETSSTPLVEEVFAASSDKRRRILEEELQHAKSDRAHEVFSLRLHSPSFSPGTIPLRSLLRFAPLFNEALERSAWREWDVHGVASKIDDGFRRLINLRLAGIRAGSTELVFLGNTAPDLTGESALECGLRNFFGVLSAPNDRLADMVNGIGKNATKSLVGLMKAFEAENVAAEFSWRAPNDRYRWEGRPDEITRVRALLEEIGDPETEMIEVVGVISVLTRKSVRIESNTGRRINARYHRSLSDQVNALHLDECRKFDLETTTYPADALGLRRNAYRVLAISPPTTETRKLANKTDADA